MPEIKIIQDGEDGVSHEHTYRLPYTPAGHKAARKTASHIGRLTKKLRSKEYGASLTAPPLRAKRARRRVHRG